MDARASLFHGSSTVDPAPPLITPLKSHSQGKQAFSGDDDDVDQFLASMTPTPSKSSVCQSVRQLVEEEDKPVGRRVSFGGAVVAESQAEKHPNKRRRREEGVPEMFFASARMEGIIAKTMKKIMMRKSKPAAARPTRGSGVEPMELIEIREELRKIREEQGSLPRYDDIDTRLQAIWESIGKLQAQVTEGDRQNEEQQQRVEESTKSKEQIQQSISTVVQEVETIKKEAKGPRGGAQIGELSDQVEWMKRRVETMDLEIKMESERVENDHKYAMEQRCDDQDNVRSEIGNEINQVKEQVHADRIEQGR